jgi:hypothetical protein
VSLTRLVLARNANLAGCIPRRLQEKGSLVIDTQLTKITSTACAV